MIRWWGQLVLLIKMARKGEKCVNIQQLFSWPRVYFVLLQYSGNAVIYSAWQFFYFRLYMRCNEGKKAGKWCFHVKVRGSSSSIHGDSGEKLATQPIRPKTYSSVSLQHSLQSNKLYVTEHYKHQRYQICRLD